MLESVFMNIHQGMSRRTALATLGFLLLPSCSREVSFNSALLSLPTGPVRKGQVMILPESILSESTRGHVVSEDGKLQSEYLNHFAERASFQFGIRSVTMVEMGELLSAVNPEKITGNIVLIPFRCIESTPDELVVQRISADNLKEAEGMIYSFNQLLSVHGKEMPSVLKAMIRESTLKFGSRETEDILTSVIGVTASPEYQVDALGKRLVKILDDPEKLTSFLQDLDAKYMERFIELNFHCSVFEKELLQTQRIDKRP